MLACGYRRRPGAFEELVRRYQLVWDANDANHLGTPRMTSPKTSPQGNVPAGFIRRPSFVMNPCEILPPWLFNHRWQRRSQRQTDIGPRRQEVSEADCPRFSDGSDDAFLLLGRLGYRCEADWMPVRLAEVTAASRCGSARPWRR